MAIVIRKITPQDLDAWLELRVGLWAGDVNEHRAEVASYFIDGTLAGLPHAVFVADESDHRGNSRIVGFAECSLRAANPDAAVSIVAHLEGWYVSPTHRRHGVGRGLIEAAANWARSRGCATLTSDTSSSYAALSTPAHLACGFQIDRAIAEQMGPPEDGTTCIGFSRSV